jgi:hypothetical protein
MSDNDHPDLMAALYALGVADPLDYAEATRRAEVDPDFAAIVEEWERRLAPLADLTGERPPPDRLFARIEARIEAGARAGHRIIRSGEGRWRDVAQGIRMKVLSVDRVRQRQTVLLDVQPGAVLEGHDHGDEEEIFMVSGDLVVGEIVLYAGDYHHSEKGSRHPPTTSRSGCRCLVVMGM